MRRLLALVLFAGALSACAIEDSLVRVSATTPTDERPGETVPDEAAPDDSVTDETVPAGTVPNETVPDDTEPETPETEPQTPDTEPGSEPESETETTDPELGPASGDVIDFGANKQERPYDRYLEVVIEDLNAFWSEEFPATYNRDYNPVSAVYAVYAGRRDVPGCGTERTTPDEIVGNAFYCFLDDFIAYDDDLLFPELHQQLGQTALGIVLAHEWGHAIQFRAGIDSPNTPTILVEQQADCFAGAWAAHLARGENDELVFGDDDIKTAILGMIAVKDENGIQSDEPGAHGSAFDRVGAFQDGFVNGTGTCATYMESPPRTIQLPFTQADFITGGNAPLDDADDPLIPQLDAEGNPTGDSGIYGLLITDLPRFWGAELEARGVEFTPPKLAGIDNDPACDPGFGVAVYCSDDNTIYVDEGLAEDLYRTPEQGGEGFGDYAIGYLLTRAYSEAVLQALGNELDDEERALLNDCLSGAYTADVLPPETQAEAEAEEQQVRISPGDLDEAVQTALTLSDEASDDNVNGSPFEKIAAFRRGVLTGIDGCDLG